MTHACLTNKDEIEEKKIYQKALFNWNKMKIQEYMNLIFEIQVVCHRSSLILPFSTDVIQGKCFQG